MKNLLNAIKSKLSLKLSLGITAFLVVVFLVSLDILFLRSRQMVKDEATDRAKLRLENMVKRVNGMMNEVETATMTAAWHMTDDQLHPDSMLSYVRRIVEMNPDFDGCSMSTEPYYFPEKGKYFSVYAYRSGDSVISKVENPYDYFDKVYYKTPITLGKPSWVEAYSEDNDGTVTQSYTNMIVSYCAPLRNGRREIVGVISTDLSMPWISKLVSGFKPYKNAYCIMLGGDGQYLIHPDSTKLMHQSIFSDPGAQEQDVLEVGRDMLAGNSGMRSVRLNGKRCIVFYESLKRAPWSISLICRESEVLAGYTKLLYVLIPLLVFGLLIILTFFMKVVARMVSPLNQLTEKLSYITHGHYDEPIATTDRADVIGRLQNNFAEMQRALSSQITSLQEVNAATENTNKELEDASKKALKADARKNEFLRDITHQIRTPLNIIGGFMQVLRDDRQGIPEEEIDDIVSTIQTNVISLNRMVNMLVVAATSDKNVKINTSEELNVRDVVDFVAHLYATNPPYTVDLTTDVQVSDSFTVKTNREFVRKTLAELVYNAKKFTTEGYVKLTAKSTGLTVVFEVEDTGIGISEGAQDKLFVNFEKGDDFSEGLGLGLPVCRQMIRMIGGDLKFDATYKGGSRFVLVLPNDDGEETPLR